MRLIDADTLSEELSTLATTITGLRAGKGVLREYMTEYRKSVLRVVDEQPTVEAMPLPCKLGDPVYIIVNLKSGNPSHIVERKCTGIHITEKVFGHRAEKAHRYLVTNSDIGFAQHIPFTQFGKTVFFTRKEAEAAMQQYRKDDT